jgi:hypothetical protein
MGAGHPRATIVGHGPPIYKRVTHVIILLVLTLTLTEFIKYFDRLCLQ